MADALRITRELPASCEAAFDAWTNPAVMRRWLFASDHGEIVDVTVDLVVGGRYSILEHNHGTRIDHFGDYLVVEPAFRLAFTLRVPEHFPETTRIDLGFHPREGGCRLDFEQSGIDPDTTRPFWEAMLTTLAEVLAERL